MSEITRDRTARLLGMGRPDLILHCQDITQQRDELLCAARAAEAIFARQKWREDSNDPEAVALRMLRRAIAGAEGRT